MVSRLLQRAAVGVLGLYQYCISPWLGRCCRFDPSCSQYARTAIGAYGVLRGGQLALWRILKCHPFHPGGSDPLPSCLHDPVGVTGISHQRGVSLLVHEHHMRDQNKTHG